MTRIKLANDSERLVYYNTQRHDRENAPSFVTYVFLWSGLIGAGSYMLGRAAGLVIAYLVAIQQTGAYPLQSEVDLIMQYAGLAIGGVGFLFGLVRQVRRWEDISTIREEQEYEPRGERMQAENAPVEPLIQPEIYSDQNGRNEVRLSKYKFTRQQWARLGHELRINDGRFVRDIVANAGVFKNITANWSEIVREFERLSLVRDGELTETGWEWLAQFPPHSD